MSSSIPPHDFSHLQDILGNLPMVKRYIVLCLCFPLDLNPDQQLNSSTSPLTSLQTHLSSALANLSHTFPFLAGRIIYENRSPGHTGTVRIIPYRNSIELIIHDLRSDTHFPSMGELRERKFPFSMLDSTVLAPRIAATWITDDYDVIAPVLVVQVNVVRGGGVVVTFCGNHTVMDMTGLGMVISWVARACRGEGFSVEEVRVANQQRKGAVPLYGEEWEAGGDMEDVMMRNFKVGVSSDVSTPRWVYFNVSNEKVVVLKRDAGRQSVVPYVSTDDAIAALCWQRVSWARFELGVLDEATVTQFCRVISVRKYFGLEGYMSQMVDCVYEREVKVWERSLGEIAGRLRRGLQQDDQIRHHTRAYATLLDRYDDKSQLVNGAILDFSKDVCISSYGNVKCCEMSFGDVLGVPEVVRRPREPLQGGESIIMPKARNGDVAIGFFLSEAQIEKLRGDKILLKYAEYVG